MFLVLCTQVAYIAVSLSASALVVGSIPTKASFSLAWCGHTQRNITIVYLKCCSSLLYDFCNTVVAFKNRTGKNKGTSTLCDHAENCPIKLFPKGTRSDHQSMLATWTCTPILVFNTRITFFKTLLAKYELIRYARGKNIHRSLHHIVTKTLWYLITTK